jgi:hypothetical protein
MQVKKNVFHSAAGTTADCTMKNLNNNSSSSSRSN